MHTNTHTHTHTANHNVYCTTNLRTIYYSFWQVLINIYMYQYGSRIIYCQISILGTEQGQKFLTDVFQRPAGYVI